MAPPLIATKLHMPRPRRDLVRRDRLHELLDRGADSRLTLVSAPAGFGKTTLLVDWLAARKADGHAVAWVSLDRGDNEPAAFWSHLIAAIEGAAADLGQPFPELLAPDLRPDRGLTVVLVNALAGLTGDLAIVLDDLHLVESAGVTEELAFLLDHLPQNVRLIASTRADPPLPLARLRARGELSEIRSADLRFRAEEAADYLTGAAQLELAPGDVETLEQRAEGWIAALQLAALSMRGRKDVSGFVASFAGSDRYVVDYLVEEVLQRQPETIRGFLYGTCMLGRFSAELCDAVLGTRGGGAVIEALDQQNLFIVALDDKRQWYRYHHLFADVLAAHMPEAERERLDERHRRASAWFDQHGERDDAIAHAIAAHDFDNAGTLIERATGDLRQARRDAVLRNAIEALPDALVRARPALSISLVGPLLQAGITEGVAKRLDEAEARLRENGGDAFATHIAEIEVYRTALAQMRGDMQAAIGHARRVFDHARSDAHLDRAAAAGFLAIVAWSQGDLATAGQRWTECTDGLLHIGYVADALGTLYARGQVAMAQGQLDEAERLFERGLALAAGRKGYPPPGSADLEVGLADVSLARSDLAGARDHLARSESSTLAGMPQYPSRKLVVAARLAMAVGDLDEALILLDEATRLNVPDFFPVVRPIPAIRARIELLRRDWPAVDRWQRESGVGPTSDLIYSREYEHVTLARLLLAKGDVVAALALLDRLLPAALSGSHTSTIIELRILRALALDAEGDRLGAGSELRQALDLAEPLGLVRVFFDDRDALAPLLRTAATGRNASAFARKLAAVPGAPAPPPLVIAHPDLLEPLSERELDVLRLLRGELSGPDIAETLGVSLNTVRTHTKNIYEKLGVNNRRAAARRAEEMNLLRRDSRA